MIRAARRNKWLTGRGSVESWNPATLSPLERSETFWGGSRSYDNLRPREQAVVRAEWAERTTLMREGLDFADEFARAGDTYSELGPNDQVVHVDPLVGASQEYVGRVATGRHVT